MVVQILVVFIEMPAKDCSLGKCYHIGSLFGKCNWVHSAVNSFSSLWL